MKLPSYRWFYRNYRLKLPSPLCGWNIKISASTLKKLSNVEYRNIVRPQYFPYQVNLRLGFSIHCICKTIQNFEFVTKKFSKIVSPKWKKTNWNLPCIQTTTSQREVCTDLTSEVTSWRQQRCSVSWRMASLCNRSIDRSQMLQISVLKESSRSKLNRSMVLMRIYWWWISLLYKNRLRKYITIFANSPAFYGRLTHFEEEWQVENVFL